jgi:hypothetical protein
MAVAFPNAIQTGGGLARLNNFAKRNVLCGQNRRRDGPLFFRCASQAGRASAEALRAEWKRPHLSDDVWIAHRGRDRQAA